jgi:hypothetical protein
MRKCVKSLAVAILLMLAPAIAYAQATTAVITGVVKDSAGGVLPGVTVQAASPALIEKTRSVVTDGTGQYRIVDLVAGTYSVTISLTGFSTFKRDGIELSGSFVATVNAELKVGSVEETITVSGESPIVDVQSAKQQVNVSKDELAALPTSRIIGGLLNLIPGITGPDRDVGGANGVTQQATWGGAIHGGQITEGRMLVDGFLATNGGSGGGLYLANTGTAEVVTVSTGGGLGEAETGGVLTNAVPRDGSNNFTAMFYYSGANGSMQSNNYTQALQAAGLTTPPNHIIKLYDVNPAGGGRLIRDRLWFYSSVRVLDSWTTVPDMWFNLNDGLINQWTYNPNLNGPQPFYDNLNGDASTRLTWQAKPRIKLGAYYDEQWKCEHCVGGGGYANPNGNTGGRVSPDGSGPRNNHPGRLYQGTWSSPISNKLLAEAGYGVWELRYDTFLPRTDGKFNPDIINVVELQGIIPGLSYRQPNAFNSSTVGNHNWRASLSYVPGAHNIKVGYFGSYQDPTLWTFYTQGINTYTFNNGVPTQFTMQGDQSNRQVQILNGTSLYAQDQWTRKRLTLQGGVRYDHQGESYGAFTTAGAVWPNAPPLPAQFINPAIVYPAGSIGGVSLNDITPRMGAAYDLFGDGKTAINAHLGKYPLSFTTATLNQSASANLPLTVTRSWVPTGTPATNPNYYTPNCNILNPLANGGCGAMSDQRFGQNVMTTSFDPALESGWGVRQYQWEGGISVQRELFPRVSVNAGYFYRSYGNFYVTQNRAVTAADFDTFTVVSTQDPRLPGGGNVKPAFFGLVNNYVTKASNFGNQVSNWKGVDASINAHLTNGLEVRFGMDTGRTLTDNCQILAALPAIAPTNPFCHEVTPYLTQWRGFATYSAHWGILLSADLQLNPGLPVAAVRNVPSSQAALSLGRPLSGGASTVSVNFIDPALHYSADINQLDLRAAKVLKWKSHRFQVGLDLYNALNTGVPTNINTNYVPNGAWLTPTQILPARFIKFSTQVDF